MASSYRRLLVSSVPSPGCPDLPSNGQRHIDPGPRQPQPKKPVHPGWEMAAFVVGGALFLAVLYMIIARHFLKRNTNSNSRARNPSDNPRILFNTQEDLVDEEHGMQLDHPIWYIRTTGLDQSVIDSIAVFKYKAGEGLIDGMECSVCLNEFTEDDSLRLLPKCSHAFHVPCIDTWLQSHKNCPICRAPIVRDGGAVQPSPIEPSAVDPGSNRLLVVEDLHTRAISESTIGLSPSPIGELGASENGVEDNFLGGPSQTEEGGKILALPDQGGVVGEETQQVRRSVSMDSPSASEIYRAMAIAMRDQSRGTSKKQAVKMKSFSLSTDQFRSCGNGRSGLFKMVKSCSFGAALGKEPIPMKRPSSTRENVR